MPEPIRPMHELERHDGLFEPERNHADSGISDMQAFFMGIPETKTASNKFSEKIVDMLKTIYDAQDEIITAAQKIMSKNHIKEAVYRVPSHISDGDLLNLKTQGLIAGSGRAVKFTEAGRIVLRDNFLKEPNQLKENRKADKFDIETGKAVRSASTTNKFKRV